MVVLQRSAQTRPPSAAVSRAHGKGGCCGRAAPIAVRHSRLISPPRRELPHRVDPFADTPTGRGLYRVRSNLPQGFGDKNRSLLPEKKRH